MKVKKNPKVVVVGVGALGSHFIEIGRNLPVEFVAIDHDRVEPKNVKSQFHTRMGLNRNKTQALQQTMKGLFGLQVQAIPHKLTEQNVNELLGQGDILIDCLDNAPSRRLVQAFARAHNTPCLHGALAAEGAFGRVLWDEVFVVDEDDAEGAPTCENGEFLYFIVEVAAVMVQALQEFLEKGRKMGVHLHPSRKIFV